MKSANSTNKAIAVTNLKKSYNELHVLKGITFSVGRGTVLALLGPNGAGKTTTVRILSTLLKPDSGSVQVNGYDARVQTNDVKRSIGLTGQYAAVDEFLTGEENLIMMGRLLGLHKKEATKRARELLRQFDLVDAAKRPVKTYSGGMRRRLDLAVSLIATPPIIFLDEPTTGLDPPSRLALWDIIKKLVQAGTTVLLTTQYMEEADRLADKIIVLDQGKIIAQGTADELKRKVGRDRIEIVLGSAKDVTKAKSLFPTARVDLQNRTLSIMTEGLVSDLTQTLTVLQKSGITIEGVSMHRPTLDDVFLTLTGHTTTLEKENKQ